MQLRLRALAAGYRFKYYVLFKNLLIKGSSKVYLLDKE